MLQWFLVICFDLYWLVVFGNSVCVVRFRIALYLRSVFYESSRSFYICWIKKYFSRCFWKVHVIKMKFLTRIAEHGTLSKVHQKLAVSKSLAKSTNFEPLQSTAHSQNCIKNLPSRNPPVLSHYIARHTFESASKTRNNVLKIPREISSIFGSLLD